MPVAIMGDAELAGTIGGLMRGSLPDLPVVLPRENADLRVLQGSAVAYDDALAFQSELRKLSTGAAIC